MARSSFPGSGCTVGKARWIFFSRASRVSRGPRLSYCCIGGKCTLVTVKNSFFFHAVYLVAKNVLSSESFDDFKPTFRGSNSRRVLLPLVLSPVCTSVMHFSTKRYRSVPAVLSFSTILVPAFENASRVIETLGFDVVPVNYDVNDRVTPSSADTTCFFSPTYRRARATNVPSMFSTNVLSAVCLEENNRYRFLFFSRETYSGTFNGYET